MSLSNWHSAKKSDWRESGALPYITQELKLLRRQRQRVYRKEGKSVKYKELKDKFDSKLKTEAEKYQNRILDEVREVKLANSYKALRKLEFGSKEVDNNILLPKYAEKT